jgi:hypothetical protein
MITFFTSAKPFRDRAAILQRNTIACWRALCPTCEILIIGAEEGGEEVARAYRARWIPEVARTTDGTPLVSDLFAIAEREASFPLLLFANADILFTGRLPQTMEALSSRGRPFLLTGRRRDLEVEGPIDFSAADWQPQLEREATTRGRPAIKSALDYFGFVRGMWGDLEGKDRFPPFALGRTIYDNWLVYWARRRGIDVVNGSDFVLAVHQRHDYSHHRDGERGAFAGSEAQRNLELAGGERHCYSTLDATHKISKQGRVKLALARGNLVRRISTFFEVGPIARLLGRP